MKGTTILLTAIFAVMLAVSVAGASRTDGYEVPTSTPEKGLNAAQVSQLLDDLQNGLANNIEDGSLIEAISAKWNGHTNLAGKTRSQILPLLMADVKTVVTDKEARDAIWESWNDDDTEEPAAAPAVKNDGPIGGGWVKLVHQGHYQATFDTTWDEPGKEGLNFHADNKSSGYQQTLTFPTDATNIRLHIANYTGLASEPKHDIVNRSLTAADMNKCLIIEGTTMASTMRVEACDSTAEVKTLAGTQSGATWLGLYHYGSYIAHFSIIWNEPGRPDQTFHSDEGPGFNKTIKFPNGASNFRVNITSDTGLSWEPTREIINRSLTSAELNKCLVVDGAALGPRIRFEPCDPSHK